MADKNWEWDTTKEYAALLVVSGGQTQAAISSTVGVSLRTLQNWIAAPEFKSRVEEHRAGFARDAAELAIAQQGVRIARQQADLMAYEQVERERADYWQKRRAKVIAGIEALEAKLEKTPEEDNIRRFNLSTEIGRLKDDAALHPGITTGRLLAKFDSKKNLWEYEENVSATKLKIDIAQSIAKELGQVKTLETAPVDLHVTADGFDPSALSEDEYAEYKALRQKGKRNEA